MGSSWQSMSVFAGEVPGLWPGCWLHMGELGTLGVLWAGDPGVPTVRSLCK